ncbi:hypothetical protein CRG98_038838 [Punica granatum]|uniref:poly(A)-specific ribonuclease n=1 Tax=Punica granatum TaxID=22663 RepID=A0A2I0IA04_PUNGR|nr:hypothetical protein CRG98_038838 [Punica granatum]
MSLLPKTESVQIREVWSDNLEHEFELIREIVDEYPYLAMDTEFPGIVLRPVGNFKNSNEYHYQTLKCNVDTLKLIQLGLTFTDEEGNLPTCGTDKYCIWQFNFREFYLGKDVFAAESIELLKQSGIDFEKNNERGIDAVRFGELLMSSGIVLNDNVQWLAELLEVERVGICHQAGSDSLLTACTFRKLKENFFSGSLEKYAGVLYGLGVEN